MYNAHDPTEHRPWSTMVPPATTPRESPAEWLMRRLRREFGLEFIYVDLSERGRRKVLDYAGLMLDWERQVPRKPRKAVS